MATPVGIQGPTPIYPNGRQNAITVKNTGGDVVYLAERSIGDPNGGFPLGAKSSIIWDAGKPLYAWAPTGQLIIADNSGNLFDAQAIAGEIIAGGLAQDIATEIVNSNLSSNIAGQIAIDGAPPINKTQLLYSSTTSGSNVVTLPLTYNILSGWNSWEINLYTLSGNPSFELYLAGVEEYVQWDYTWTVLGSDGLRPSKLLLPCPMLSPTQTLHGVLSPLAGTSVSRTLKIYGSTRVLDRPLYQYAYPSPGQMLQPDLYEGVAHTTAAYHRIAYLGEIGGNLIARVNNMGPGTLTIQPRLSILPTRRVTIGTSALASGAMTSFEFPVLYCNLYWNVVASANNTTFTIGFERR